MNHVGNKIQIFERGFINSGNRTEWSPIRSVIIRVITKLDNPKVGVRFVNHEYDYELNWTTQCLFTNINQNNQSLPQK